jgi:hypothetical protein
MTVDANGTVPGTNYGRNATHGGLNPGWNSKQVGDITFTEYGDGTNCPGFDDVGNYSGEDIAVMRPDGYWDDQTTMDSSVPAIMCEIEQFDQCASTPYDVEVRAKRVCFPVNHLCAGLCFRCRSYRWLGRDGFQ